MKTEVSLNYTRDECSSEQKILNLPDEVLNFLNLSKFEEISNKLSSVENFRENKIYPILIKKIQKSCFEFLSKTTRFESKFEVDNCVKLLNEIFVNEENFLIFVLKNRREVLKKKFESFEKYNSTEFFEILRFSDTTLEMSDQVNKEDKTESSTLETSEELEVSLKIVFGKFLSNTDSDKIDFLKIVKHDLEEFEDFQISKSCQVVSEIFKKQSVKLFLDKLQNIFFEICSPTSSEENLKIFDVEIGLCLENSKKYFHNEEIFIFEFKRLLLDWLKRNLTEVTSKISLRTSEELVIICQNLLVHQFSFESEKTNLQEGELFPDILKKQADLAVFKLQTSRQFRFRAKHLCYLLSENEILKAKNKFEQVFLEVCTIWSEKCIELAVQHANKISKNLKILDKDLPLVLHFSDENLPRFISPKLSSFLFFLSDKLAKTKISEFMLKTLKQKIANFDFENFYDFIEAGDNGRKVKELDNAILNIILEKTERIEVLTQYDRKFQQRL